jgi:phosphoserine phosphatase
MAAAGKQSPAYDPNHPPYAVFDWDNTSVFLDVEEATLVYQLGRFDFVATPPAFEQALRQGAPDETGVDRLIHDILADYAWLYLRRKSGASPEALGDSPRLLDFRAKYLKLYQDLEATFGAPVAYPWLPHRFTAMTDREVRQLTRRAVQWQLQQPIETITWSSPESLPGQAGAVSAKWRSGLRLLPEMQSLYASLRAAGFDVWVCTASFEEGIREISSCSDFGYGNDPRKVIGLGLERDSSGRYLPRAQDGSVMTYGAGKSEAIRRQLVSRYGYGPVLVAGDSNGDAAMLSDFPQTRISLIIDAKHPSDSPIGQLVSQARALRGKPGARYLVQDRDELEGTFGP